jgi:TonB dependent receptor
MSNADTLYEQKALGHPPQTERLQGIEAAYDVHTLDKRFSVVLTGFVDDLQILSWDSVARTTEFTGNGQLWGGEAEVRFVSEHLSLSLNHSLVRLLNWRLAKGQTTGGFSYSDINRTVGNPAVTITSTGHSINNWSTNTTKLVAAAWLFDRRLELGLDAQFYWGFEGIQDQLQAVQGSIAGSMYEQRGNEIIAALRSLGAGGPQLHLNASVSYRLTEGTRLSLYGANLAPFNSKRYYLDSGATGPYPVRVKWVEEPTAFGVRLETNY